jgi:hypothetical protein
MPTGMAKEAARLAKRENRTMSELMREALRHYTARRQEDRKDDLQWLEHVIAATKREQKKNPMTPPELLAESDRLARYGARQAKKLGIKERDIVGIIHQSRARRRAS